MAEANRRGVATVCGLYESPWASHCNGGQHGVHGDAAALTKTAGDDVGTVLGQDKGVDQREVHGAVEAAERAPVLGESKCM